MYKRFNNDLLNQLQNAPEGMKIGNVDVTSPTCADDIALLSQKEKDAQILTNTVHEPQRKIGLALMPANAKLYTFKLMSHYILKYICDYLNMHCDNRLSHCIFK